MFVNKDNVIFISGFLVTEMKAGMSPPVTNCFPNFFPRLLAW